MGCNLGKNQPPDYPGYLKQLHLYFPGWDWLKSGSIPFWKIGGKDNFLIRD
jgi:hypothetical protein